MKYYAQLGRFKLYGLIFNRPKILLKPVNILVYLVAIPNHLRILLDCSIFPNILIMDYIHVSQLDTTIIASFLTFLKFKRYPCPGISAYTFTKEENSLI